MPRSKLMKSARTTWGNIAYMSNFTFRPYLFSAILQNNVHKGTSPNAKLKTELK